MARSVKIKVGGVEYTLCFSFNALCELEEETGKGVADLFAEDNMSLKTIRTTVWAGLRDEHPDLGMRDVGNIIDAVGISDMQEHLAAALQAAFPDMTEEASGNGKGQ